MIRSPISFIPTFPLLYCNGDWNEAPSLASELGDKEGGTFKVERGFWVTGNGKISGQIVSISLVLSTML